MNTITFAGHRDRTRRSERDERRQEHNRGRQPGAPRESRLHADQHSRCSGHGSVAVCATTSASASVSRARPCSAGNGKSETNNEVERGKDLETKSRTEGATGTFEMPFLGVKSLKTLSSSCS